VWYETRMGTDPKVDAWFHELDHHLEAEMQRVREIVLGSDDRITETIKWKTPTFMYGGNIASFNPRAKAHVSLLFHTGASIPGDIRYSKVGVIPPNTRASMISVTSRPSASSSSRSCEPGAR